MGKHSQETKTPRRHTFVEKAPVLAAMVIAGIFVSVMQAVSSFFFGVAVAALRRIRRDTRNLGSQVEPLIK